MPVRDVIVLTVDSLAIGGTQRVVTRLAGWMAARGLAAHILTISRADPEYDAPTGVLRSSLMSHRSAGRRRLRTVTRYRAFLKEVRPTAVLSFGPAANVASVLAARPLGIRVAISERTAPERHRLGVGARSLRPLVYPRASALVLQTESLRGWGMRLMRERPVHVIPNAVPLASLIGTAHRSRTVLSVGRLHPQKGHDLLIQGFAEAGPALEDWQLEILGDGPDRPGLENRIRSLGLEERVLLRGNVDDVQSAYERAGMFVLASRYEGFPNALLEAMATGTPAVATDCLHGPNELIEHWHNGVLVPSGDSDGISVAMQTLASNPALRTRLGRAAHARAAEFSPDSVTDRWLAVVFAE